MPVGQLGSVFRHIRRLAGQAATGNQADSQLLARFSDCRDEAAFAALMERHGPLVFNVCRRVLGNVHDADDAFQATFLVLARKAGSIRQGESVGSWLYGVAYRLASKARGSDQRRRSRERQAREAAVSASAREPAADWEDLRPVLDEELSSLPEKYRSAIVLRYFQGKGNEEAARELGCPPGSLSWRLSQALDLLRQRLARRGIAPASAALGTLLADQGASAAMPATLAESTLRAALLFAGVTVMTDVVSPPVASLATGLLNAMWRSQALRLAASALFLVAIVTCGFALSHLLVTAPSAVAPDADQTTKTDYSLNWPMFGGSPGRNMANPHAKNLPSEWSVEPANPKNIRWVRPLGTRAYGGPVVAGGRVYVGTNNERPLDFNIQGDKGILLCLRESNGTVLWQAVHDKLAQRHDWAKQGVCSTPVIEGNRLYYVSNRCEVVCARTEGSSTQGVADTVWRLDMRQELKVYPHNMSACSPLIVGDLLFVVTANGVDDGHVKVPSPEAPSFLAINKHTGKVVWQDNSPGKNILHGQWSNPTFASVDGQAMVIFPGGDGWLRGFDPATGQLLWKFDGNPKASTFRLGGRGDRSDFVATPVVYDNKLYIGTGQDPEHYEGVGHLWCIDLRRAVEKGKVNPGRDVSPVNDSFDPKAAVNKDSALHWHFGGMLPPAQQVNRDYLFGRTLSTCAIHDGLVYAAELAGYLHCLDAHTGQVYWVQDVKAAVWGSPFWADGKVYLATEDGEVWVFVHGKEKKLLSKIDMQEPIRSTPIAVNGVLYVMTERHLYAIASK